MSEQGNNINGNLDLSYGQSAGQLDSIQVPASGVVGGDVLDRQSAESLPPIAAVLAPEPIAPEVAEPPEPKIDVAVLTGEVATILRPQLVGEVTAAATAAATQAATQEVKGLYANVVAGAREHVAQAQEAATSINTVVAEATDTVKSELQTARDEVRRLVTTTTETTTDLVGHVKELADGVSTAKDEAMQAIELLVKEGDGAVLGAVVKALRELRGSGNTATLKLISDAESSLKPRHSQAPLLEAAIQAGVPAYLHGEAGSGKSTGAKLAAGTHDLPFDMLPFGPTTAKSDMLGYNDAGGVYHSTPLRRIVEGGGVFLFDEIDAADSRMLVLMNATLANGHTVFPDKNIEHDPKTRFVAAANTIGRGANAQYVGRNRLDAATLDRFAFIEWNIDPALEEAIVLGAPITKPTPLDLAAGGVPTAREWLDAVRKYREAAYALDIKQLITPRAALYGKQLAEIDRGNGQVGVGMKHLVKMLIHKGAPDDTIKKWEQKANPRRY